MVGATHSRIPGEVKSSSREKQESEARRLAGQSFKSLSNEHFRYLYDHPDIWGVELKADEGNGITVDGRLYKDEAWQNGHLPTQVYDKWSEAYVGTGLDTVLYLTINNNGATTELLVKPWSKTVGEGSESHQEIYGVHIFRPDPKKEGSFKHYSPLFHPDRVKAYETVYRCMRGLIDKGEMVGTRSAPNSSTKEAA